MGADGLVLPHPLTCATYLILIHFRLDTTVLRNHGSKKYKCKNPSIHCRYTYIMGKIIPRVGR